MITTSALNDFSQSWAAGMFESLIDTMILVAVLGLLWGLLHKRLSAQFGYCLFMLVLIKAVVPAEFAGPAWLTRLSPRHQLQQLIQSESADAPEQPAPLAVTAIGADPEATIAATASLNDVTPPPPAALELNDTAADTSPSTVIVPAATLLPERLSWQSWLLVLWLASVAILLLRFAWEQLRFRLQMRSMNEISAGDLPFDLADLQSRMGVRRTIRCFWTDDIASPALCGIIRPCLLLPSDFANSYTAGQRSWIVLHELAHVRRRDLWAALFQRLVQILHFFNPAIWIVNVVVNRLREFACDDAALAAAGAPRRECGDAFLRAVEKANRQSVAFEPALGMFRAGRTYRQRLLRIMDSKRSLQHRLSMLSIVMLLALAAVVLPGVRADDTQVGSAIPADDTTARSNPAVEQQADKHWIAELPFGGTVELIAVAEHPSGDGPWWRADGSMLKAAPYDDIGSRMNARANKIARDFVFQFEDMPEDILRSVEITWIGSGSILGVNTPFDQQGEPLPNLRVKTVGFDPKMKHASIRISVPSGDWMPLANFNGQSTTGMSRRLDGKRVGVTFLPARRIGNQISLEFAHNIAKHEVRVVAVDKDGKTRHLPSSSRGAGASGFSQKRVEFVDLRMKDINRFQLEVRRLHYVQFSNIATQPEQQTDVQIESDFAGWGSVSGQFLYGGEPPQPKVLVKKGDTNVRDDAVSAAQTIYSEELLIDPDTKGIANVFVYLRKRPTEVHPALEGKELPPIMFDSVGRQFTPHALIARAGQRIQAVNADPIYTNVHVYPARNPGYNVAVQRQDRQGVPLTFKYPERQPFAVKSDIHTWMKSYWLILDHPYAALTDKEGRFTIKNLPAGRHQLTVWHEKYGFLDRQLSVEVKNGKTTKLAPRRIGPQVADVHDHKPFIAVGNVTDSDGRPVAGVVIRAATGIGTLKGGAMTKTDDEGNYKLQFGPGFRAKNPKLVQAAVLYASKSGMFETNLSRQGSLICALEKPDGVVGWGKSEEDLFLPGMPKTVDFTMAPAAKLQGVLLNADGQPVPQGQKITLVGKELPPASNVLASTTTDERGQFEFTNVPTTFNWYFSAPGPMKFARKSTPFRLADARGYHARVTFGAEDQLEIKDLK